MITPTILSNYYGTVNLEVEHVNGIAKYYVFLEDWKGETRKEISGDLYYLMTQELGDE